MGFFGRKLAATSAPELSPSEFAQEAETLIPAEVRMISGCHSEQTSADVSNVTHKLPNPAGRAGGACTSALLEILWRRRNEAITFQQVLLELRDSLAKSGYDQIPQLTSSRPLDVADTRFSLVGGSGIRRALLVGINYRGQSGQLSGCHNDVLNVKDYLIRVQGYSEEHILVLVDDGGNRHYPTRTKMIAALRQLVAHSVAGDSVYFHYSGHGGLLSPDWNAFKSNNKEYDETLYPLDHHRSGQIRDFSLFNHFVKPMKAGVTVTCVMDCCHSGSVLNLPYSFRPTDAGTILVHRSMSNLSNLAFLYILAGGFLPLGLEGVTSYLDQNLDGNLDDYWGTGMDDAAQDGFDYSPQDVGDNTGDDRGGFDGPDDYGDAGQGITVDRGGEVDDYNAGGGYGDAYGGAYGAGGDTMDAGDAADLGADCGCIGDVLDALSDA